MEKECVSTEILEDALTTKKEREEELLSIVKSELSVQEIKERLEDFHANDIASVFGEMDPADRKKLYHLFSDDDISDIFSYLDNVEEYIAELDAEKAAEIIENMDAADAVDVLEELEDDTRREIIDLMDEDAVEDIEMISSFDEEQIGSRMTTNFIFIPDSYTVKQAMKSVIEQAAENDNISKIYVVNEDLVFCGAIDLRDLVIARSTSPLDEIITVSYPYLFATEQVSECIEYLKDYSEDSIPVLDGAHKILGVITAADIVEAVGEEFEEDYAKLAGLTEEEDLSESVGRSVKKRLPWLLVLLALSLCVSAVVGLFDAVIDRLAYLVFFQSMILGMAGNVGTQSLAVTIRVLSSDDCDAKTSLRLIFKEMRIGIFNGIIVGLIALIVSGAYLSFVSHVTAPLLSALCISLAMAAAMLASSFFGTMIPILFKRMKIDPAVASGPLITTVNDLVAVCVYYSLAILLLMQI